MSGIIKKAKNISSNKGKIALVKRAIQFSYNRVIRSKLPRRICEYNGIPVYASRAFDSVIPWHKVDIPDYEGALIEGIHQYVKKGDTVVLVGGGWGISTVVAANETGSCGHIITYEGGEKTINRVKETVRLNNVNERTSVHHAIVGGCCLSSRYRPKRRPGYPK
jgi:hypothetical protein